MYSGQTPQNPAQNRPRQPHLQLPERQYKRFSWQASSTEELPQQGNGNKAHHRASRSIDSEWSYEETPIELKNPQIQRLARDPNMATIAQSPVTPIDGRPQSVFDAQIPLPTQQINYSASEYPPEKSASAFQTPLPAQAPANNLELEYPPDKPLAPYNVPPPSQTHPAMHAPVVEPQPPVSPQPQPHQISQHVQHPQQIPQQMQHPQQVPQQMQHPQQVPQQMQHPQRLSQQIQQLQRHSVPRQSIPFIPQPIQIPSYTHQRTPNHTPGQTPRSPSAHSPLPRSPPPHAHYTQQNRTPISPGSPGTFLSSYTPVSPPISPGALPQKNPDDFDLPSPDFTRQRPISSHQDVNGPISAASPLKPVFSPTAPTGPNGLDPDLHQPGQISHPNMDMRARGEEHEWKHSLCECSGDIGTCVTGLFCPCILYGRTAYRLSQKTQKKDPTVLLGHSAFNGQCGLMASACGLWCLFPLIHRTRLRHLYKLTGSLFSDIGKACCCCCCVAIQNEREVRDREESARRWAGPAVTEVYQAPGQMVYAPPPRG